MRGQEGRRGGGFVEGSDDAQRLYRMYRCLDTNEAEMVSSSSNDRSGVRLGFMALLEYGMGCMGLGACRTGALVFVQLVCSYVSLW